MTKVARMESTEPQLTAPESRLRADTLAERPRPWHEMQPDIVACLNQLLAARKDLGAETCSQCDAWAQDVDSEGRGIECCSVLCVSCLTSIAVPDGAPEDSDGRKLCDDCAARIEASRDRLSGYELDRREHPRNVERGMRS